MSKIDPWRINPDGTITACAYLPCECGHMISSHFFYKGVCTHCKCTEFKVLKGGKFGVK